MSLREKILEDIEQYSDVSSIIHTYFKSENTLKIMKQQNLRLPANQNMDDEQYIIEQEILESDATAEQIICENFDWILTKVIEKDNVISFANERDVRWLSFGFAKEFEKRYEKELKEKQAEELKKEFLKANIHNNIKKRDIDEER